MKHLLYVLFLFFPINIIATDLYFCTAANDNYYNRLLNLIGSIHATNFGQTQEIAVFDLGLTHDQLIYLNTIDKVKTYTVELTNPDLLKPVRIHSNKMVPGWYAWKPVVIKQALEIFPYVLWIDAGSTVLKPLDNLFEYIQHNGYFLATAGDSAFPISTVTKKSLIQEFELNKLENAWILDQEQIMAGVIGITKEYQDLFITPLYELSKDLENYCDDGTTPRGFGIAAYEQVLLSIIAYLSRLITFKQDASQKTPIVLPLKKTFSPFYITWKGSAVCDKTHIYSSRTDLGKFDYYIQQIHFKI